MTLEFSVVEQKIASFYCDPGVVEHKISPFTVTLECPVVEYKTSPFTVILECPVVEHNIAPFTVTLECPVVEHNIAPYTTESEWGRVVNTVQWFAQRQYLAQGAQWAAMDRTAVLINAP